MSQDVDFKRKLESRKRWQVAFQKTTNNLFTPETKEEIAILKKKRRDRKLSVSCVSTKLLEKSNYNLAPEVISYLRTSIKTRYDAQTDNVVPLLGHLRYFEQIPYSVTRSIVKYSRYIKLVRNEKVLEQGQTARFVFVLLQGKMTSYCRKNQKPNQTDPDTEDLPDVDMMVERSAVEVSVEEELQRSNLARAQLPLYGTKERTYQAGSGFGEQAMWSQDESFPVTLVGESPVCHMLVISRVDFETHVLSPVRPMRISPTAAAVLKRTSLEREMMSIDPLMTALSHHPTFHGVSATVLEAAARRVVLQTYPPFHQVFEKNDPGMTLMILVSGSVSVHAKGPAPPMVQRPRRISETTARVRASAEMSARVRELWQYAVAALTGPVFRGYHFKSLDPEASPYTMNEENIPDITAKGLFGRPLEESENIMKLYGGCQKVLRAGSVSGVQELCTASRRKFTAITREATQFLVLDHIAHAQILKSALAQTIDNPTNALRSLLEGPRQHRTKDVAGDLVAHMRKNTFFKDLPDVGILKILMAGQYRRTAPNEVVFQQGDPADYFYVILSGSITIHITKEQELLEDMRQTRLLRMFINIFIQAAFSSSYNQPHWVAFFQHHVLTSAMEADQKYGSAIRRLEAGDSFGELGITQQNTNVPPKEKKAGRRAATIISETATEFLILNCDEYRTLVKEFVEESCYKGQIPILHRIPMFRRLQMEVLKRFATWMIYNRFPRTKLIASMDARPDNIYFILSGKCKVVFNPATNPWREELAKMGSSDGPAESSELELSDEQVESMVPSLGPGSVFGAYEHLLEQSSYTRSLVAATHTEVFQANAQSFVKELERQQDIQGAKALFMTWAFENNKLLKMKRLKKLLKLRDSLSQASELSRCQSQPNVAPKNGFNGEGDQQAWKSAMPPRHYGLGGVTRSNRSKRGVFQMIPSRHDTGVDEIFVRPSTGHAGQRFLSQNIARARVFGNTAIKDPVKNPLVFPYSDFTPSKLSGSVREVKEMLAWAPHNTSQRSARGKVKPDPNILDSGVSTPEPTSTPHTPATRFGRFQNIPHKQSPVEFQDLKNHSWLPNLDSPARPNQTSFIPSV